MGVLAGAAQPPDMEPLVVVWAGALLGAGGFRDGFTVGLRDVGLGFGRELGRLRAGAEVGFGEALAVLLAGLDLVAECPAGGAEGEGLVLTGAAVFGV